MTLRTIAVVFLALACGASMAIGVLRMNSRTRASESGPVMTASIVVAARPLSRSHKITEQDVTLRSCSAEWVTDSTFTKIEDVVGQVTMVSLPMGDVIAREKLGETSSVAWRVKPNMRAYTIQTSRVASNVAGFIMPGDKVDVLLNLKGSRGDSTGGGSTTTLLQAVEVLAVAQILDAPEDYKVDPTEMTSVTLHVTPQQVNDLDLGQNMGVLTLSLRNPEDEANAETVAATVSDVRFLGHAGLPEGMVDEPLPPAKEKDVAPKKPAPVCVVTLRGRHRGRVVLTDSRDF